jgi:hypothetical protein
MAKKEELARVLIDDDGILTVKVKCCPLGSSSDDLADAIAEAIARFAKCRMQKQSWFKKK